MIRITVDTDKGRLIEDFNRWDNAMSYAHSNEWNSNQVTVGFLTNGSFYHELPLYTFTQPRDYIAA